MTACNEDLGFDTQPRYVHSCRNCTFLGRLEKFDLYFCQSVREPTVIARSGEGGNYASGMCFSFGAAEHLKTARRRAQTRGLLQYPLEEGARGTKLDAAEDLRAELKEALGASPVARAMQTWGTNPAEARRQLAALSEAKALGYQAQFPDLDLPKLRGWVREHYEHLRTQLEAFKLPAPTFFEVYGATEAAAETEAACAAPA